MKKKVFVIIGVLIGIIGIIGFTGYFALYNFMYPNGHELDVTINNNTDFEICELFLTYRDLKNDILVDCLGAGETYHKKISAKDNVDESSLILYYYDDNNILHEQTVIGYFEGRGGGQASVVTINSVDEEGVLDISIAIIRP